MQFDKFCHSCAAPLGLPDFQGPAEDFCKHCTDETGKLKPREEIRQGIAMWLKNWQPEVDDAAALRRADSYMAAMPAWAE